MIDKLVRKNIELQQKFLDDTVEKSLCAGCDVPSIHLQYSGNGKQYCPRCYEEVEAMRKYEDDKNKVYRTK